MSGETSIILRAKDETQAAFRSVTASLETLKGGISGIDAVASRMPVIGGAITAAFGAASFTAFIGSSIDAQAKLHDLSLQSGATVESLSAMTGAAKMADVGIEDVAAAAAKLSVSLSEARLKGGDKAKLFQSLGIDPASITDAGQGLYEVAKKLDAMPDKVKAVAVARDLLGKSASMPLLNELAQLEKLTAKVTAAQAAAADQFQDNVTKLSSGSREIGYALANSVLPAMNDVLNFSLEVKKQWGAIAAVIFGIGGGSVLKILGVDVDPLKRSAQEADEAFKKLAEARSNLEKAKKAESLWDANIPFVGDLRASRTRSAEEAVEKAERNLRSTISRHKSLTAQAAAAADDSTGRKPVDIPDMSLATKAKSDYEKLMDDLRQSIAQNNAEISSLTDDRVITGAEKKYAKFLSDIAAGDLKLNPGQMAQAAIQWDQLIRSDVLIQQTKDAQQANQIIKGLVDGWGRDNASKRDALSNMSGPDKELADALRKVENEAQKAREALDKINGLDKGAEVYKIRLEEINESLGLQREEVKAIWDQQQMLNSSAENGVSKGVRSYMDEVKNMSSLTQNAVTSAFRGMEDSLVEFVRTGKLDFKSLADSIVADLIRIQIRQSLVSMTGNASGGGSIFSGLGNLFSSLFGGGRAEGGAVSAGRLYEVNERAPELLTYGSRTYLMMGTQSGTVNPPKASASNGGSQSPEKTTMPVIVQMVNNGAQQSVSRAQSSFDGQSLVVQIVTEDFRKNGPIAQALSASFGLVR